MAFAVNVIEIKVCTSKPFEFLDITDRVEKIVKENAIYEGLVAVNVCHTTCALAIQEADSSIHEDSRSVLDQLVPISRNYNHSYEGNVNGSAHQRQQLLGSTCTIPIREGKPFLGRWQRVFLIELFMPMERTVAVTVIGKKRDEKQ